MTWSLVRRMEAAAALVPLAGLGVAALLFAVADRDTASAAFVFALGTLPVSGVIAAVAARRRPAGVPLGLGGALAAALGGLAGAQLAAMVRIYQAGARGFWSLAAAPYTQEVLMVLGVVPALAFLGAVLGGGRKGVRALVPGLVAGLVASPVVGVGLIAVRALAGFLNPVLLWLAVVVGAAAWGRMTKPSA